MLVFAGKIDFKVIIRAIKKYLAKISFVVLFIAVVKEFYVLFVGSSEEGKTIINLVFRNRRAVVKMRKNGGNRFGFGAGKNNPGKDELCHHIVDMELETHLRSQDIHDFLDV